MESVDRLPPPGIHARLKLSIGSLLGILIFFMPFEWSGKNTILVDHLASALIAQRPLALGLVLALIGYGALSPLVTGQWRRRLLDRILSLLKLAGLGLALMYVADLGPAWLMTPDRLPFLFDKLALSVGVIVPIGSMALTFCWGLAYWSLSAF
nr:hypothetical protein [Aeromonas cavernicola]